MHKVDVIKCHSGLPLKAITNNYHCIDDGTHTFIRKYNTVRERNRNTDYKTHVSDF